MKFEKNSRINLDRLQNKCAIYEEVKNNTNFGQINEIPFTNYNILRSRKIWKAFIEDSKQWMCSMLWDATERWLVVTDFSGQLIGTIFKGQAVGLDSERCNRSSSALAYGTDRLSRNVGNYPPTLRNIQEERRDH